MNNIMYPKFSKNNINKNIENEQENINKINKSFSKSKTLRWNIIYDDLHFLNFSFNKINSKNFFDKKHEENTSKINKDKNSIEKIMQKFQFSKIDTKNLLNQVDDIKIKISEKSQNKNLNFFLENKFSFSNFFDFLSIEEVKKLKETIEKQDILLKKLNENDSSPNKEVIEMNLRDNKKILEELINKNRNILLLGFEYKNLSSKERLNFINYIRKIISLGFRDKNPNMFYLENPNTNNYKTSPVQVDNKKIINELVDNNKINYNNYYNYNYNKENTNLNSLKNQKFIPPYPTGNTNLNLNSNQPYNYNLYNNNINNNPNFNSNYYINKNPIPNINQNYGNYPNYNYQKNLNFNNNIYDYLNPTNKENYNTKNINIYNSPPSKDVKNFLSDINNEFSLLSEKNTTNINSSPDTLKNMNTFENPIKYVDLKTNEVNQGLLREFKVQIRDPFMKDEIAENFFAGSNDILFALQNYFELKYQDDKLRVKLVFPSGNEYVIIKNFTDKSTDIFEETLKIMHKYEKKNAYEFILVQEGMFQKIEINKDIKYLGGLNIDVHKRIFVYYLCN